MALASGKGQQQGQSLGLLTDASRHAAAFHSIEATDASGNISCCAERVASAFGTSSCHGRHFPLISPKLPIRLNIELTSSLQAVYSNMFQAATPSLQDGLKQLMFDCWEERKLER